MDIRKKKVFGELTSIVWKRDRPSNKLRKGKGKCDYKVVVAVGPNNLSHKLQHTYRWSSCQSFYKMPMFSPEVVIKYLRYVS